jgi:predicted glutamine amidotransferase
MLIASGNVDMNPLIDGLILMAEDQNEIHEKNCEKGLGTLPHGGGWGIAYLNNGKWVIHKSLKAIFDDPNIDSFRNIKTNLVVLHARYATMGNICLENTHPFHVYREEFGDVVFCHNGTIEGEIPYCSTFKTKGTTDSERLFYSLLTEMREGKNEVESIWKNMERHKDCKGINFIMVMKDKSFISVKENIVPRYYQMKSTDYKGMAVVSSERLPTLPNASWRGFNQGDVVVLTNGTDKIKNYKKVNLLQNPLL